MAKSIFIASPLFNPEQHQIIQSIENLCADRELDFYSARHDSEAHVPKGEEKKNPAAWQPVFDNNEEGLKECLLMIAVLSYALPEYTQIMSVRSFPYDANQEPMITSRYYAHHKPIELPDSGTVWEMGYFRGIKKIVVGFHPEKRGDHLNLMLTHGCDGLISGWDKLEVFFQKPDPNVHIVSESLSKRIPHEVRQDSYAFAQNFNWSATEQWGAQVNE